MLRLNNKDTAYRWCLWLSAPKPIVPPGTPFPPGSTDLQTWMRNGDLDPDWSRVGTDITHQGPFNGTFTLSGSPTPEPSALLLEGTGLLALVGFTDQEGHRIEPTCHAPISMRTAHPCFAWSLYFLFRPRMHCSSYCWGRVGALAYYGCTLAAFCMAECLNVSPSLRDIPRLTSEGLSVALAIEIEASR